MFVSKIQGVMIDKEILQCDPFVVCTFCKRASQTGYLMNIAFERYYFASFGGKKVLYFIFRVNCFRPITNY